jgi:hypothetical protein
MLMARCKARRWRSCSEIFGRLLISRASTSPACPTKQPSFANPWRNEKWWRSHIRRRRPFGRRLPCSSSAFGSDKPIPWRKTNARLEGYCRDAGALSRHSPRAKLRTEASRGIVRAPTFTASIRPALTSRLTVLSLTSPSSACVAFIEISSGSSAKRWACLWFAGFTSRNDLRGSRSF